MQIKKETAKLLGVCADADKRRLLFSLELLRRQKKTAVFSLELNAEKDHF